MSTAVAIRGIAAARGHHGTSRTAHKLPCHGCAINCQLSHAIRMQASMCCTHGFGKPASSHFSALQLPMPHGKRDPLSKTASAALTLSQGSCPIAGWRSACRSRACRGGEWEAVTDLLPGKR